MGCLPIDLAGIFGPHHEVEGLLCAAMIKDVQAQPSGPSAMSRKEKVKRLKSTKLQAARSSETAIEMQCE